jgi:hypothetical protein
MLALGNLQAALMAQHHLMKNIILITTALLSAALCQAANRGFNLAPSSTVEYTQADFNAMRAAGATLVRMGFGRIDLYTDPGAGNGAPKRNDGTDSRPDNFDWLDKYVTRARSAGLKIIIDPHQPFGAASQFTTFPSDPFYKNNPEGTRLRNQWVQMWRDLANYLDNKPAADRDAIWGFDLINEPRNHDEIDFSILTNWHRAIIREIREVNTRHRLILDYNSIDFRDDEVFPPEDYAPSTYTQAQKTALADDIIFSSHYYGQLNYTHQGVDNRATNQVWPDASKAGWANSNIATEMARFSDWFTRNGVNRDHGLVGEWGLTQGDGPGNSGADLAWDGNVWNPPNGAKIWLREVYRGLFGGTSNHFHWTMHVYGGGNPGFDVTYPRNSNGTPGKRFDVVKAMLANQSVGAAIFSNNYNP